MSDYDESLLLIMANDRSLDFLNYFRNYEDNITLTLCMFEDDEHIIKISREQWITNYLEFDFYQLFRVTKNTFFQLLSKIDCVELNKPYRGGHIPVHKEKQLLAVLWWLGKGETLMSVSDKFGLSLHMCYRACNLLINKIVDLQDQYIQWPTKTELISIEEAFRQKKNYPGVIGAIDGCNVKFKAPLLQQESYIDKNCNHSIKLQAICTAQNIFTNVFVGFPGSAHDSRVFRNTGIYLQCIDPGNRTNYFPLEEYHLLGDKAYPLMNWLLTPYKGEGRLQERQRRHNTKHSQTRIAIEHSFGILKSRWRILKYINVNSVKKAVKIIGACCVLHNFCTINRDLWDSFEPDDNIEQINDEENQDLTGILKRYQISLNL